MKKLTITVLATGVLLSAGTMAWAFGGGPGGPGGQMMRGPMMYGPGMSGQMMRGPGMSGPMMWGPGRRGMFMGSQIFNNADANKDGVVTREEAKAAKDAIFAKFDTNKDGVVNSAEIDKGLEDRLNQMRTRMRYRLLGRLDANGDGQVSKEEFDQPGMRRFDMLDANNDGKITREEVQTMRGRGSKFMRHKGKRWYGRGHRRGMSRNW